MQWITTNIRLPQSQYMSLKIQAARRRKSMASLIREKLDSKKPVKRKKNNLLLDEFRRVAEIIEKENRGIDLTKKLIEMRYEQ